MPSTSLTYPSIDILCFFCTADPPHLGHAGAIQLALKKLPSIQKVLVIPPQKHVWDKDVAGSFEHRVKMCRIAFEKLDPRVQVSTVEHDVKLSGYTFDTLQYLSQLSPTQKFGLLIGADTLEVFEKWSRYQELLETWPVLVAPRFIPPTNQQPLTTLAARFPDRIFLLPDDSCLFQAASSTQVRDSLVHHQPSSYLDPEVAKYLAQHQLFKKLG